MLNDDFRYIRPAIYLAELRGSPVRFDGDAILQRKRLGIDGEMKWETINHTSVQEGE